MRSKYYAGILLSIFIGSGCATGPTLPLDPEAKSVIVVEYLNPATKAELTEIDMVSCELGMNSRSQEDNIAGCKNKLRNEAKKIGGSVVLLEPEKQQMGKDHHDRLFGNRYCPNCIKLRGIVFAEK